MKQLHMWPLSMENTRLQPNSEKTYVAMWTRSFEYSISMEYSISVARLVYPKFTLPVVSTKALKRG